MAPGESTAELRPPAPKTLEETGLNIDLVTQLVLKTLHLAGTLTGVELAAKLGVGFAVIEPSLDALKWQHHVEIVGAGVIGGPTFKYRITDVGRERAALFFEHNHYVGFAPVPLGQYQRYMTAYRACASTKVHPDDLRRAFSHLVLSQRVLDQLGPAVCAGHSLFVYGPPGNGKTVISQSIGNLLAGEIAVPHAVEVEGSVVRVFDPVSHSPLPDGNGSAEGGEALGGNSPFDRRWVRCRRPEVTVGGELGLDALELSFSPSTGFYRAPVQMLANGGLLVIDDFGRQHCSPRDLLNRWIVPLESRVDFLTLQSGLKFEIPFVVFIVFATNIKPAELVDEAFLRRIQYKVFAESPTREDFADIFRNYCETTHVEYDSAIVDHLLQNQLLARGIGLRGCQPRDLIDHAMALADYAGAPRRLTPELMDAACDGYFVEERRADPQNHTTAR